MKKSTIPRPTESAALARVTPRVLPSVGELLWALAGCEAARDAEGRLLVGNLLVRAAKAVQ
ncbi:hypothetical protein [Streptacidiphilus melanogenes]|uniref:hypothetical protein n=1 Tax=Streptacidiphilus melanogenes TaxID=411235 RepID=UPI000A749F4E|nr:hypothetical protein [Streptacidiphilus melanogenes]